MDAASATGSDPVEIDITAENAEDNGKAKSKNAGPSGGGDAVYALGMIGAGVYFWKRADTGGGKVRAILKSLVWPAFLVYEAFSALEGRSGSGD